MAKSTEAAGPRGLGLTPQPQYRPYRPISQGILRNGRIWKILKQYITRNRLKGVVKRQAERDSGAPLHHRQAPSLHQARTQCDVLLATTMNAILGADARR